jgi:phosphatidylglycerophosphatase C
MPIGDRQTGDHIAVFDFDGTLTTHDTFFRFLCRSRPWPHLTLDLAATGHLLLLYAAGLVANDRHKMALFARQFGDTPVESYRARAVEFSQHVLPGLLRPVAVARMHHHQAQGHKVLIVTASLTDWIQPWAESQGVTTLVGSRAQIRDGRLTGRLEGANCYGAEKLRRLLELFPNRDSYHLSVYGDSDGDRELLAAADHAYYRRFDESP